MKYQVCPDCGANLDFGEICDCKKERDDSPTKQAAPSAKETTTTSIVSCDSEDVKKLLALKETLAQTDEKGKNVAAMVRDIFPSFNRQLLTACINWERYGVLIHPVAFNRICNFYGVSPVTEHKTVTRSVNRRKQITFRCSEKMYDDILSAMRECGIYSMQSFVELVVQLYVSKITSADEKRKETTI